MIPNIVHSQPRGRCQRRIHRPTRLHRACSREETVHHQHAADEKEPKAQHIELRKRHVDGANLQRHHVIAERSETKRHNAEEHHDGAVHGAQHVVQLAIDDPTRRPTADHIVKDTTNQW